MRAHKHPSLFLLTAALLGTAISGCASEEARTPPDEPDPYAPPPASAVVEDGPIKIRREVFLVQGVVAPPNPVTGAETPPELNQVRVVRYRVDADPPEPARAVAVLMPGFLGGAGSFDPMARAIVRRSQPGEALEAWAIDRRSNLLEDHHGLDVAEVLGDPELARGYYFEDAQVEGKTFPGYLPSEQVSFASEWGLATTIGDLRAVIGLVGPADRKARVVLIGHSLGATLVEEYAAWDFDGTPGYAELAGLALVDGGSQSEGDPAPPVTLDAYMQGVESEIGTSPGLDAARSTTPYIALPFLGLDVYLVAAVAAMRARWTPAEVVDDSHRDKAFTTLLALPEVPKMTNRAAMGFAFDDASNGVSFAAVSCGTSTGGPTEKYTSLLGPELVHPSDPSATYDWIEFDQTNPPEHTSLDDLARSWYEGPSLDFAEWYFPSRLSLDAGAAGTLVLAPGDWPLDAQGLRAIHGAAMDLPILGAVAGLVADTAALDKLRALVDPVPIGPDRPLAGAPRSDPDAFKIIDISNLTHIDPLSGTDSAAGTVPAWYDTLVTWMKKNTPEGGVIVPTQPAEPARM